MVCSGPRQSFGITSPLFSGYALFFGRTCIWRTAGRCCRNSVSDRSRAWKLTSSTHTRAVQKTWTIRNRYDQIHTVICMPPTVSLSDGRRLTWLRDLRPRYAKEGLYLGCRWSQASGAVASWCSGEATRCRQTRNAEEDDRCSQGAPAPLRQFLHLHEKQIDLGQF